MESIVIFVFGFDHSSKLRQLRQFWIFDSTVPKVTPDFLSVEIGFRYYAISELPYIPPSQSESKCEATDMKMIFLISCK